MNYLQLANRLRLESGGISGTGPTTVVGNSNNEYARVCNWIADADVEIQLKYDDWRFMWNQFSLATVAGTAEYTEATITGSASLGVSRYDLESFRYYLTSAGIGNEQHIIHREYRYFRERWLIGNNRASTGAPSECTFLPNRKIHLAPIPNAIYTVTGDFYRNSVRMTLDGDEPLYPSQFHMLPVWWALVKYAGLEEAPAVYTNAQNQLSLLWGAFERQERPNVTFGGPLV